MPSTSINQIILPDFPCLGFQALDFRLGEISPFVLQALDVSEPDRVRDGLPVAEIAHLLPFLLGREPVPSAEGFPTAQDLLPVNVEVFPVRIEFRQSNHLITSSHGNS